MAPARTLAAAVAAAPAARAPQRRPSLAAAPTLLLLSYDEATKGAAAGDVAGDQSNIGGGGAGAGGSGAQAEKQSAKRVAIYQKLLMTGACQAVLPGWLCRVGVPLAWRAPSPTAN